MLDLSAVPVKFTVFEPKIIGVSKQYRGCYVKSKIARYLFAGVLIFLIFISGMVYGSYRTYDSGYQDGKRVTNSWWIDKQSRYYDTDEVDNKRRNNLFDHL